MVPDARSTTGSLGASDPLGRHSATPTELQQVLEAERAGRPFLAMREDGGALHLHPLDESAGRLAIGRHPSAGVPIAWDDQVSGLHAEVERLGGEWTVADDGLSRNGTFVNGQRLRGRHRLRDGDRIRVGRTVIAVKVPAASRVAHTAVAGVDSSSYQLSPAQRRVLVALCRPCWEGGSFTAPASNQEIAAGLFLSTETVKMHLRALFAKFGLDGEPQNQKRAKLAEAALHYGLISAAELD